MSQPRHPGLLRQSLASVQLAGRDSLHEWPVSLCLMLALAAVLGPLLVLFGLKSGIVTTMTERLKADPRNLEITIRGNHQLDAGWIRALGARPDVGFVVPRTRTLAATVDLVGPGRLVIGGIDMIATAAGDPLLPIDMPSPLGLEEVLLSHSLARKLAVTAGETVEGRLRRRLDGREQDLTLPLRVIGVLPEASFGRDALFVPLALLVAAEDYRDGIRVPELGAGGGRMPAERPRPFAGVRLYAGSLEGVSPLAEDLRAEGFDILTRAKEIETVRAIDRTLNYIFVVIATVGVSGVVLSLAASLWANVDRKRRELAVLRLVGLKTIPLVAFPAAQALIVAVGGLLLSAGLYALVSQLFNSALSTNLGRDELVCRLAVADAMAAAALTLVFALGASTIGAYRASRIDPADNLRDL